MRAWTLALFGSLSAWACKPAAAVDVARGNVLRNRGDLAGAVDAYRAAAQKAPKDASCRVSLGDALMDLGRFAQAREAYAEAVETEPRATDALVGLANASARLGDDTKAREALGKVLDLQPAHAFAKLSLANLLLRAGDAQAAAALAGKVVADRPKEGPALYVYGQALTAARRYDEARRAFDRLEVLRPNGPEAPFGRAHVAGLAGDRDTAVRELKTARNRGHASIASASDDPAFAWLKDDPERAKALFAH